MAERSTRTALRFCVGYMVVQGSIYFILPEYLIRLFESSANSQVPFEGILADGTRLLHLAAFFQILAAILMIHSGALRGAGDTLFSMWAGVILAWLVWAPGSDFLICVMQVGVVGAWAWTVFYFGLLALAFTGRWKSGRWRAIGLLENSAG